MKINYNFSRLKPIISKDTISLRIIGFKMSLSNGLMDKYRNDWVRYINLKLIDAR